MTERIKKNKVGMMSPADTMNEMVAHKAYETAKAELESIDLEVNDPMLESVRTQ